MMLTLDTDIDRPHLLSDGVKPRLLLEIVVNNGPRRRGPAIVRLPHQSATAQPLISPLPPPSSIREMESLALHQLGQVDVALEVGRGAEVLDNVRGDASLVPVGLVVEVHCTRAWVAFDRAGDDGFEGGELRESLKTKLADETAAILVKALVFLLVAVPNFHQCELVIEISKDYIGSSLTIPLMDITRLLVIGLPALGREGRAGPINDAGAFFSHGSG